LNVEAELKQILSRMMVQSLKLFQIVDTILMTVYLMSVLALMCYVTAQKPINGLE